MNIENIKNQVKAAFEDVDSKEFLQLQIGKGAEKHRRNFREYISIHPKSNFTEWKEKVEKSVNPNTTEDIMAIGIFLLALDEFNYENL